MGVGTLAGASSGPVGLKVVLREQGALDVGNELAFVPC